MPEIVREKASDLVRLNRINSPGPDGKVPDRYAFPFARSWFYKHKHLNTYPELFIKFGAAVFVDRDRFFALMEEGRGQPRKAVRGAAKP